ncbi:MAG: hypothetical protein H3Z49_05205 [archaeon]|nr:hypothetical protein [archaeon]
MSELLYQQAIIRVEREDDDEQPKFYSVRWWLRERSSKLHCPIDWCCQRKSTTPNYDRLEKDTAFDEKGLEMVKK